MKVSGILEKKNKNSNNNLTNTLLFGLIGLVLLLMPSGVNKIIGVIIGFILFLMGIINVYQYLKSSVKYNAVLISGILYSLLGMIILLSPGSVIRAVAIGIGVCFLVSGFIKIGNSINYRSVNKRWAGTLIIGIVVVILGLLLIFNPISGVAITKVAGAFLSIVAIFNLIDMFIMQK